MYIIPNDAPWTHGSENVNNYGSILKYLINRSYFMSDNKILKNILKKYGGVLMSHGSNTPILTHTMTNIATSVSTYHP